MVTLRVRVDVLLKEDFLEEPLKLLGSYTLLSWNGNLQQSKSLGVSPMSGNSEATLSGWSLSIRLDIFSTLVWKKYILSSSFGVEGRQE